MPIKSWGQDVRGSTTCPYSGGNDLGGRKLTASASGYLVGTGDRGFLTDANDVGTEGTRARVTANFIGTEGTGAPLTANFVGSEATTALLGACLVGT